MIIYNRWWIIEALNAKGHFRQTPRMSFVFEFCARVSLTAAKFDRMFAEVGQAVRFLASFSVHLRHHNVVLRKRRGGARRDN